MGSGNLLDYVDLQAFSEVTNLRKYLQTYILLCVLANGLGALVGSPKLQCDAQTWLADTHNSSYAKKVSP